MNIETEAPSRARIIEVGVLVTDIRYPKKVRPPTEAAKGAGFFGPATLGMVIGKPSLLRCD
jgi:hypothetical protein